MEVHPLQSFPSSETGRGLRRRKTDEAATAAMMMKVKKESNQTENDELSAPVSPSINLGLQIGTNSAGSRNERTSIVHRSRESLITVGQLQELEQQVLIHKYLAAGLRVPTHLLVPIWKSVARTLGSNVNVIGFNPVGFDYGSMMEPEPWRCRRTDGKKWRCSRTTVPHQKYCERHMHRGRQRSRKPVEASENDSTSKKIMLNNPDREIRCTLDVTTAIPFPHEGAVVPEPKTVSYACTKSATETITSSMRGASAVGKSCADATKTIRMIPSSALNTTATCITTVPSINPTATTSIPTSYIVNLKDACNMNFRENCIKSRNDFGRNDINIQKITSPGLGFSPNSVLQVSGCSSSLCDSKINLEREPGRCRRTDGKKWRCRRDIIPNQKYCSLHMHRGSKKHLKPSQNAPVLAPSAATYGSSLLPTPLEKLEPATPNTNLSMSIQADDKQRHNEARNNASSSSETTITDTTITA